MAEGPAAAGADAVDVTATLEPASAVEHAVVGKGRVFKGHACIPSDRAALRALIAQLDADGITPGILIGNVGTILRAPATEHPAEDWDKVTK